MTLSRTDRYTLFWAALGGVFFLPFLGGVHLFDWDEINFAEAAREMLVTGNFQRVHINFEPFWEKPPLFFLFQAGAMKLFGIGEYAARFPNAVCGMFTLAWVYRTGTRLHDHRFGMWWALAYFGSLLPHLYFKSGIIDPWFNFFIILGYTAFARYRGEQGRWSQLVMAGLWLSLAILTKGPAAMAMVLPALLAFAIIRRKWLSLWQFMAFCLLSGLGLMLWAGAETVKNGAWFLIEFVKYQYRLFSTPDAGHGGFPGYHVVVLLAGCFPASVFFLRSFGRMPAASPAQQDYALRMKVLFWVVLILFSIVKSKIIHYSSLAYFPITYLAATVLSDLDAGRLPVKKWLKWGLGVIGGLLGVGLAAFPFVFRQIDAFSGGMKDPFARASLEAPVDWPVALAIPGILFLTGLVILLVKWNSSQRTGPLAGLFVAGALVVQTGLGLFIGRIESYSQRAAVEMMESLQGKDVYVHTYGFKSYIPWFYSRKARPDDFVDRIPASEQPPFRLPTLEEFLAPPKPASNRPRGSDREWLLTGDIDKDAYFLAKTHRVAPLLQERQDLEVVEARYGYSLVVRRAKK